MKTGGKVEFDENVLRYVFSGVVWLHCKLVFFLYFKSFVIFILGSLIGLFCIAVGEKLVQHSAASLVDSSKHVIHQLKSSFYYPMWILAYATLVEALWIEISTTKVHIIKFLIYFILIAFLFVLASGDRINYSISAPLSILAFLVFFVLMIFLLHISFLLEIISAFFVFFLILILILLSRRKMGFGDALIFLNIGTVCGITGCLWILSLASFFGCIICIPLLFIKKLNAKTAIPFVPFITAATAFWMLLGQQITHWYISIL
ncbi:Prepilin signal peptidase PulO (type II secretory pathway) [Alicyclobacillus tolerans]|uniref:Prepilin signal peptidase PulO (Type II secretory pathway) n=1 Tax=Alicyclobacillus tolerans TaxID=90970 RepID=A0A1M6XJ66_9BACL|nr:Prepilin signal peptidase PulO (type II secretory pathway) [Alicyclobacillus montanus]